MSTRGSLRQSHVVPLPLVNCLSAWAVIGAIAINRAIHVFMKRIFCSSAVPGPCSDGQARPRIERGCPRRISTGSERAVLLGLLDRVAAARRAGGHLAGPRGLVGDLVAAAVDVDRVGGADRDRVVAAVDVN